MVIFRFSILLILFITSCLLMFTGCATDNEQEEVKLTRVQADQAIEENAAAIQAVAHLVTNDAPAAATTGNVNELLISYDLLYSLLFKSNVNAVDKLVAGNDIEVADEFIYDGNGCWKLSFDSTDALSGYNVAILAQVCFDTFNLLGRPTEATNQMDYEVDFDFSGANPFEGGSFAFDLGLNRALQAMGIADYNSGNGNLILNGAADDYFDLSATSLEGSQSLSTDYSYTLKNIAFQPDVDFPVTGIIEFSISFTATPPIPDYPNFSISGTITFDGSSIVVINFAGYTYSMNLVSGDIY